MKIALAFAIIVQLAASAYAATYRIDPDHSSVGFRVRHLIGHVNGQFDKFEGTFDYEPKKPQTWKTSAKIDASSVDTKVQKRDDHLRSADFLDVKNYPEITFVSTKVSGVKGSRAKLLGKLTIHGVTKSIALDLEIGGVDKDAGGNERAAFSAKTKINRKDYGLTWNDVVESGGALVGDIVEISIEAEGIKQK